MRYVILALFMVGCGGGVAETSEAPTTWDVWLNHGQPTACHGYLTMDSLSEGGWECGDYGGPVDGRLLPDVMLTMDAAPGRITIRGNVRDWDGAIIARTADGRPFVGYLDP